jgi:hypothetical protein
MAALTFARLAFTALWFARRYLPPEAQRQLRRSALAVALAVCAIVLAAAALAALVATGIVAALGEDWLIPLAVAAGIGGACLACLAATVYLIAPLRPRRRG